MPSCLRKPQGKTLPLNQQNKVTPGAMLQSGSRVGSGAHGAETSSVVPLVPSRRGFHRRIASGATKKLTPLFSEQHSSEATVLWWMTTCWGRRNGSGVRLPWMPFPRCCIEMLSGNANKRRGFPHKTEGL